MNLATDLKKKTKARKKVNSFGCNALSVKLQTKVKKISKYLQGTKDLFDRLLPLSTDKQFNLERVLTYPLTSVPLTFAHIDGTKTSTDKLTLQLARGDDNYRVSQKYGCCYC